MKNLRYNFKAVSKDELEMMIERYFDCELSEEEEILLRNNLAHCKYKSKSIDEALATMGFLAEGAKHYSFMIGGGRIYNPEEFKKVIDENIKKAGGTYSEQFLKIKKKEIKKNRKKFKKLMRIANEGANEIMNDSLTYNRKLKELIDSNVEFDKKLKPIPEEMVIREKKALKSIKL